MKIFKRRNLRLYIPLFVLAIFILSDFISDFDQDIPTREMNKRINPEIYPAFRRTEIHAYEYVMKEEVNRREYERCKELISRLGEETEKDNRYEYYSQPAQGWYSFLRYLGFELPPLYLDREPTKEEREKSKKMSGELESELWEVMKKHTDFLIKEMQDRLDSNNPA